MKYKFRCPDCGRTELEQVLSDAVVITPIINEIEVEDGELGELEYGSEHIEDGDFDRYQCSHCGAVIAKSNDQLVKWLKENTPNKYSVCLFPRIKVRIPNVAAKNQAAAVWTAHAIFCDNVERLLSRPFEDGEAFKYVEQAEDEPDFIALVDEEGDEEFDNSNYHFLYTNEEGPVIMDSQFSDGLHNALTILVRETAERQKKENGDGETED